MRGIAVFATEFTNRISLVSNNDDLIIEKERISIAC